MKEESICKIKDSSVEFGTGMGLIFGVAFMLALPEMLQLIFTYKESLLISSILVLIFAGIFCIKGLVTRKKLKSQGNWHEYAYSEKAE